MNFFVKSLALALDNQDVMRYNNKARGKRVCARSSADRVPGYEPVGHRFKSCRARHIGASNRMLAPISFWELGRLCRCSSFSAKRHAPPSCSLASVLTTLCCRCQLFRFRHAAAHLMIKGKQKRHLGMALLFSVQPNAFEAAAGVQHHFPASGAC